MIHTYFENDAAKITFDDELLLGRLVARGFLSGQEFREVIIAALNVLEEHKPLILGGWLIIAN